MPFRTSAQALKPDLQLALSYGKAALRAFHLAQADPSTAAQTIDANTFLALVHSEDRGHLEHTLAWARHAGEQTARVIVRLARSDGAWVSVVAKVGPGAPAAVAVQIDLDDAAAARRAEAQIRQIVEGAQQAAVVHVGRQIVYSNPALAALMGYASLEEMRTKGVDVDHTHPDDRAMVHARMAARIAGDGAPEHYEFRALRTDGSMIWLECFASRVTWNGQPASLAWLLDITDRKRTEEALRQSEQHFAAVFQASPDMLTLLRLDDGRFVDVNEKFLATLGHEREMVVGRTLQELKLFVDAETPRRIMENLDRGAGQNELIAGIRGRTGETREIALKVEALRFAGADMLLTVGRDVTERRREVAELRHSMESAEMANRAKSEFLANMSHELRTPLNAIIGFSEVITRQLFGPVGTPRYADYARDIWNSGTHLLQIINDLLDLSKLDAGKQELHESAVSLLQVIEESLRLVRERAVSAAIDVRIELVEGMPNLRADERMLKQILINLLSNSIKFTPRGGRISIRGAVTAAGAVELAVSDTGIGMTAAEIEVALTPFGQVDNAFARSHQGTGLGLPLVRALAELHGGRLTLQSLPNVGTTATVTFPPERVLTAS